MDGKCLMTDDELNEIEARAAAATAGPWEQDTNMPFSNEIQGIWSPTAKRYVIKADMDWAENDYPPKCADVKFLAHARTDVPALVAELRRLRASSPAIDMDGPNYGRWVWVADGPIDTDKGEK